MFYRRTTSLLAGLFTFCLSVPVFAAGRTWHVAPRPLPGVADAEQFRTISEAAKVVDPGDTVLIHTGIYREQVTVDRGGTPDRPITFEAAPAAHVVITGADRITQWTRLDGADNIYTTPWSHVFIGGPTHTHPDDDQHLLIGRAEQVFVTGYPLRQVLKRERMERGTFFVDEDAKLLDAWAANNSKLTEVPVEASTRSLVWQVKAPYVTLRGLCFRYAADMAQHGAVNLSAHTTAEDCVVEDMNAEGVTIGGEGVVIRRCTIQDCGQLGFGCWKADNLLVTDCIVRNNNTKQYSRGWEAGGDKVCFSTGAVIQNSQFLDNRGSGIWFDIANHDCTVRNCLIKGNEDGGIFYEISYGLHADDNVIVGNGFAESPGAWGAQAGICLSSSPGCVIERNLLVGNREGFDFREQDRTTPLPDQSKEVWVWNHDQVVRNNVLAYNRDAQVWGYFDTGDERQWPAAMQDRRPETEKARADQAAAFSAKHNEQYPAGLSLEKLKLQFANNFYAVTDGEPLFNWGVPWHRNKRYTSLDDVRVELGLDQGSVVGNFAFNDFLTLDFRVPTDSPAVAMGCYPKGEVPGVKLGVVAP